MVASRLWSFASSIAFFFSLALIIEARPLKRDALPNEPRNSPSGNGLSGYSVPLSDGTDHVQNLRNQSAAHEAPQLLSLHAVSPLDIFPRTNSIFRSGSQSLPTPNCTLKFITIARGTQNYTCTSVSPSPVLVGANAVLLDASPLLSLLPPGEGTAVLDLLPSFVIDLDFAAIEASRISKLGIHYFDIKGVPTFDLGDNGLLKGKGFGDIPAPANASAGPFDQGYGAVDWKALTDAGGSVGLKEVYRVETAGGKASPSCAGVTAPIYVDYSALYWFYE